MLGLMRVHLVDGTFELFRAHFSPRPGRTAVLDGKKVDVKATVGVALSMIQLLQDKEEKTTHLAVAFDNPIRSFRNDLYDGYKTDEGVPPELHAQFDLVEDAMKALGIVVWSMKDFEADDALAAGAVRFAKDERVEQVRIMTPDKDLGQVVSGTRIVQIDRMRRKSIDEAALTALRGVGPESIADWLALMGDTSDGYPGLPGWGAKTSAQVLARYKTIEQIPSDYTKWDIKVTGAPRLSGVLEAHRQEAALYKQLAILRLDTPIEESLDDLEHEGFDEDAWAAFGERLQLKDAGKYLRV